MKPKEVIDFFGNANRAAKALGLKRTTVGMWKTIDYVAYPMQIKIERLTGGVLKADEISVTVDDILKFFGSIDAAARSLIISPDTLRRWRRKDTIPFYFQRTLLAKMRPCKEESKKVDADPA